MNKTAIIEFGFHRQGFHYAFVQEVGGVFQPAIFSFSYESK